MATDTAGAVLWSEHHSPFGEVMNPQTANDDLAAFTGHIRDSATGLTYMQARYYDPVSARFLSIDPVTFTADGRTGMFNRYSYTFNDPVNMIDQDGRFGTGIGEAYRAVYHYQNGTSNVTGTYSPETIAVLSGIADFVPVFV